MMTYLRPDAKSQVTVEYGEDRQPVRIHTIVVSTQHDNFDEENAMLKKIEEDVQKYSYSPGISQTSCQGKSTV